MYFRTSNNNIHPLDIPLIMTPILSIYFLITITPTLSQFHPLLLYRHYRGDSCWGTSINRTIIRVDPSIIYPDAL